MKTWPWIVAGVILLLFIPIAGYISIAIGIFIYFRENKNTKTPTGWLADKSECEFSQYNAKTGVALDTANKIIHLKNGKLEKSYPFSDIREWKYNVQKGGEIYGGGVATIVANTQVARDNAAESGFFVFVRDIDNPSWRISFQNFGNKKRGQLERWMEIFNQRINES